MSRLALSTAAVDSIVLSTTAFSPNENDSLDTIGFAFPIQAPARAVVQVATHGQNDTLVVVWDTWYPSAGRRTVTGSWDGRIAGVVVPDGDYDFRFLAGDSLLTTFTSNQRQFRVDTVIPRIDSLLVAPRPFTPTLPGSPTSLDLRFRVSGTRLDDDLVGVEILQGADTLRVDFVGEYQGDGNYYAPCRTCDEDLDDGVTTIEVFALDIAGNYHVAVDSIDANLEGPRTTLTRPATLLYFTASPDSIVGRSVDRQPVNGVDMLVSGALDTTLTVTPLPGPENTTANFRVLVSALFVDEGTYVVRFAAIDADGVSDTTQTLRYTVDRTAPAAPVLSPPLPAETRAIQVQARVLVDSTASELIIAGAAIAITPRDINGPVVVVDLPLVPGLNTLTFQVEDGVGNRSPLVTANVFRVNAEGISAEERFRAGQTISIDAGAAADGAHVRILALDGTIVRTFSNTAAQREYSFTWDLTTPEGSKVRNGPYLIVARVEVEGVTQRYRKMIAVIE